ncbi:hypothetical protein WJX84_011307 [Apatococcus fuscideae]|uniref:sulfite oxidase n=1 Tax=Apatococcus fuscideae TaxID=2026836 RepID=A0AAW1STF9_9CHLO
MVQRLSRLLPKGFACARSSPALSGDFAGVALDGSERQYSWQHARAAAAALVTAGLGSLLVLRPQTSECEEAKLASAGQTQRKQPALPIYHAEDVANHNNKEQGVWVTYKDGVYDVTDFLEMHPGGASRLMLAAGGAIDPFWAMYQQHQNDEIRSLLEGYRIGSLAGGQDMSQQVADPYSHEPQRHPALIVRSQKPFNAETPAALLIGKLYTPNDLFYVRNHLPVPAVDLAAYALRIEGEGLRTIELSLKDLQTMFKRHTISATLQCAGNRRIDMSDLKDIKGTTWAAGAIGNAEWSGVTLKDVLEYAGLDESSETDAEHVQFEGLDSDMEGVCYGASILIEKAINKGADVLLAFEMNGRPLSKDHGYPVRVIAPGIVGARNVKWLSRIIISKEESQSHWQQHDYKSFSPNTDYDTVDWDSAPAIQEPNVTSAICSPNNHEAVTTSEGMIPVKGFAYRSSRMKSGGGHSIVRVDVSADGGKTWTVADLRSVPAKRSRAWSWSLWEAEVPAPAAQRDIEIICKATDNAYNTQPDSVAGVWNLRGVLNNAWHRVKVQVTDQ